MTQPPNSGNWEQPNSGPGGSQGGYGGHSGEQRGGSPGGYGGPPAGQGGSDGPGGPPDGYGGHAEGHGGHPAARRPERAGFFKALFDFSFRHFITVRFAAVIYGIALVLIGIGALIGIVMGLFTMGEEPLGGFFIVLLALVLAPFYLLIVRLTLELYVAIVRTAENTAATTTEVANLRWDLSQR